MIPLNGDASRAYYPDTGSSENCTLRLTGLTKTFGGVRALRDVSFDVRSGEVHGLLGENGSGKSTLIKVLAGFHAPESGELEITGEQLSLPLPPGRSHSLGMEFVHQDLALVDSLSVLENLLIGDFAIRRGIRPIQWAKERERAARTFERYNVAIDPDAKVSTLGAVEQALVAIIRAMESMSLEVPSSRSKGGVLFLDEPTAFLPKDEVDRLFALIRAIAAKASVVIVTHDLDEALEITDRITVFRDGRNIGTVNTRGTSRNDLVSMILGHELPQHHVEHMSVRADTACSVKQLVGGRLRGATLDLYKGEVLGVTGLLGSGFEDLPYLLFGANTAESGNISFFGQDITLTELSPKEAIDRGIAFIPGNRQRDGSVGSLSVAENLMILTLQHYVKGGVLTTTSLKADVQSLMNQFDVRPRNPDLPFYSLSGGNQQKLLLAKWLQLEPRLLLLHEPTQGVDVGARQTIIDLIRSSTANGAAVLCASSDYEQLAQLCSRVLIVKNGIPAGELKGKEITKERIVEQCLQCG